jgi:hypothetical protein
MHEHLLGWQLGGIPSGILQTSGIPVTNEQPIAREGAEQSANRQAQRLIERSPLLLQLRLQLVVVIEGAHARPGLVPLVVAVPQRVQANQTDARLRAPDRLPLGRRNGLEYGLLSGAGRAGTPALARGASRAAPATIAVTPSTSRRTAPASILACGALRVRRSACPSARLPEIVGVGRRRRLPPHVSRNGTCARNRASSGMPAHCPRTVQTCATAAREVQAQSITTPRRLQCIDAQPRIPVGLTASLPRR